MTMNPLEKPYWTDIESTTRMEVAELEARCRAALATARVPEEERQALEFMLLNFRGSFEGLAWTLEPMREHHAALLRTAYQAIFTLMREAAAIGASQVFSDAASDFHKTEYSQRTGARGGRKSGENRRKDRAEGWEPIAREMISETRQAHPDWSQDQIATKVIGEWKSDGPKAPGRRTLTNLIGAMEKSGELRTKKRRNS